MKIKIYRTYSVPIIVQGYFQAQIMCLLFINLIHLCKKKELIPISVDQNGGGKMLTILQTAFSEAFYWMKDSVFW